MGGVASAGRPGRSVRKTDVLCRVKTQEEALRVIGRFLIYYRDNAKWLERTYDFVPRIGIEKLREIIVNDSLGIVRPARRGSGEDDRRRTSTRGWSATTRRSPASSRT